MRALAAWCAAGGLILLLAASSSRLGLATTAQLPQAQPLAAADVTASGRPLEAGSPRGARSAPGHSGRVAAPLVFLPRPANATAAYRGAPQLCRGAADEGPPLPRLKRAATWEGAAPGRDGNTTVVTTLHVNE